MKISFEQATREYVHRYTCEHKPRWAKFPSVNGMYYAPQFATDKEWYDNTQFPPDVKYAVTSNLTWPLGMWLDSEYFNAGDALADEINRCMEEE